MLSLGFHAGGPVTAADACHHSTVMEAWHPFSGRVSTQLTAPCARFLYSCRVPTSLIGVSFVLAALRRLLSNAQLGTIWAPGTPQPYVSRGPRPAMWRGPLRHDGAVGPVIFSDVTTPLPTAAAIFARSCA